MNRNQRRAAERAKRVGLDPSRGATIGAAAEYLVNRAGRTATGATLITPDGEVRYLSVEQARAMMATKPPGRAN